MEIKIQKPGPFHLHNLLLIDLVEKLLPTSETS